MKKKKSFGMTIFLITTSTVIVFLIVSFFDNSITAGATVFKIAGAVLLGLVLYGISAVFEGKSSE
jgi:hypothetical protein